MQPRVPLPLRAPHSCGPFQAHGAPPHRCGNRTRPSHARGGAHVTWEPAEQLLRPLCEGVPHCCWDPRPSCTRGGRPTALGPCAAPLVCERAQGGTEGVPSHLGTRLAAPSASHVAAPALSPQCARGEGARGPSHPCGSLPGARRGRGKPPFVGQGAVERGSRCAILLGCDGAKGGGGLSCARTPCS